MPDVSLLRNSYFNSAVKSRGKETESRQVRLFYIRQPPTGVELPLASCKASVA